MSSVASFYELKAEKPKDVFDFKDLQGKVTLLVNTASKCGFTKQYDGLEALHQKYKDQGLVVLGFPCNQFGSQEPGTDDDVASFCTLNHGVTFPLMKKSDVNGDNTNEVFKHLKKEKPGLLGTTSIKWNFTKFLVDKNGKVTGRYSSTTTPQALEADIEKLLKATGSAPPTPIVPQE
ncbi:glutathione peroxidase [Leucosporidium creatinivorum]|uniref:Glutathione peroxidase n=1 Tax=Leucosporidium creatinivorum TaxID=106004 RepID=A0A1Y2FXK7_9BASI|nr:glutathione peroxidase [Leucosporidium creatinivorum]